AYTARCEYHLCGANRSACLREWRSIVWRVMQRIGWFAGLALIAVFFEARKAMQSTENGQLLAYVGTYTTPQSSRGIYAYRFDPATGTLASAGLAAEATDPSYVAVHGSGKYVYAVNEVGNFEGRKSGAVSAFAKERK